MSDAILFLKCSIKPAHFHNYGYADYHSQVDGLQTTSAANKPVVPATTLAKPAGKNVTLTLGPDGTTTAEGDKDAVAGASCALKKVQQEDAGIIVEQGKPSPAEEAKAKAQEALQEAADEEAEAQEQAD